MRYYKQLTKNGKLILTMSVWGEEGYTEEIKHLISEFLKELDEEDGRRTSQSD